MAQQPRHHGFERRVGVDLSCGSCAQERLDLDLVAQGLLQLLGGLPVVVAGAAGEPAPHHFGCSAEQHDPVEVGIEAALVRDAPAHEERVASGVE
ncbi:hypothetical protein [Glycomyces rhizosphaerae]|uniref:Uncharacterized protein n=1 Tax=Glycomyces rhizosphaerae TaxID=2054422 RepID=A0ABV7PZ55_9ACTN